MVILVDVVSPYRVPVFQALANLVDLHVVTLAEHDRHRDWAATPQTGFDPVQLPLIPGSQRFSYGPRPIHLSIGVRRRLRTIDPEMTVVGGWNQPAFWAALVSPREWSAALWVESTARDVRRGSLLVEHAKRLAVRLADAYVVPGEASEAYLRDLGATGPIVTAPNAVDSSYFGKIAAGSVAGMQLRQKLRVKYLLTFVGRPEYAKGIDLALAITTRLGPDVGLVVLGEASERARWEDEARTHGIASRVRFEGFVGADRVAAVLGGADLMLLPSRSDPWGLVVNEAMAAACPVVTSPYPGVVEDVVAAGAGKVIPLQVDEWTNVVRTLLMDVRLRRTMIEGTKTFVQAHSPAACAAGLARLVA